MCGGGYVCMGTYVCCLCTCVLCVCVYVCVCVVWRGQPSTVFPTSHVSNEPGRSYVVAVPIFHMILVVPQSRGEVRWVIEKYSLTFLHHNLFTKHLYMIII